GRALVTRLRRRARRGRGPAGGDLDAFACARTGLRLSPHYAAAKLRWALDHVRGLERAVASGRALWGTLGTWLLWHFTGGAVYAIDHANAQRTLLFDAARLAWDLDLIEMFGLQALPEGGALPALVPTTMAGGVPIAIDGRPLEVGAMTGDQQAALPGLRCRRPGDIVINYGSGAFVLIQVGGRRPSVPGLLATLVDSRREAAGGIVARYAVEGTVNAAATAIDWARRRLGLRVRVAELDRWLGPDPGGRRTVHFLPAVSGLGAPRWDPAATPRFAGRVDAGSRDLMRAVVESIAQRCAEIVRTAHRHGGRTGAAAGGTAPVYVAGGLARCRTLLQAQADLLQRPVVVRDLPDASALGAAILADAAAPARRGGAGIRERLRPRKEAASRWSRPGGTVVLPRIPADESAARVRAWMKAVYG
ncbi:MAG: FGGY-family carbohydrate kinase, partial [Candidatus Polarisedimenticolia bacterium]